MSAIRFQKPPLNEVSFGIQFERLPGFQTAHFGLFWSRIEREFPETADRPPIAQTIEGFVGDRIPLPRVWFVHRDKHRLIQIQNDRFILNWRRLYDDARYPSFDVVLPDFVSHIEGWQEFCDSAKVGPIRVQACELTYVNHIPLGEGWSSQGDIARLFPTLDAGGVITTFPQRKTLAHLAVYELENVQLRAEVRHGFAGPERKEILVFEIQATSTKRESFSARAIEPWFRQAHTAILTCFTELTDIVTQREVWHRVDG